MWLPKEFTQTDRMRREIRAKRGRVQYPKHRRPMEAVFVHIKQIIELRELLLKDYKIGSMWRWLSDWYKP